MNSDGSIGSCYMLDKHYDGIGFEQEKKHIILFTLTDCMMIDENGTKNEASSGSVGRNESLIWQQDRDI